MAEMKPYEPRLFSDNIPYAVGDFARWLGLGDHQANFLGNRAQQLFQMTPPGAMVDAASDIGRDMRQGRVGPALLNAVGAVANTHAAGKILGGMLPMTKGLQDQARAAAMGNSEMGMIPQNAWGVLPAGKMPPAAWTGTSGPVHYRPQPGTIGMPANANSRNDMRPNLRLLD